jgi:hypothetical protein
MFAWKKNATASIDYLPQAMGPDNSGKPASLNFGPATMSSYRVKQLLCSNAKGPRTITRSFNGTRKHSTTQRLQNWKTWQLPLAHQFS